MIQQFRFGVSKTHIQSHLKRFITVYVHFSTLYNSQDLKTTHISRDICAYHEDIVHIYTGISAAIKNNKFMQFTATKLDLEDIVLSEKSHKNKYFPVVYKITSECKIAKSRKTLSINYRKNNSKKGEKWREIKSGLEITYGQLSGILDTLIV